MVLRNVFVSIILTFIHVLLQFFGEVFEFLTLRGIYVRLSFQESGYDEQAIWIEKCLSEKIFGQ